MIVYADASAVLAWLLRESTESLVRAPIRDAERVVTSSLTALECSRGLTRARAMGRINRVDNLAALQLLNTVESMWDAHAITDRVLERARAPFPADPVRALDALHLATAMLLQEALGPVTMLSLDDRIRANAPGLGLTLLPRLVA